MLKDKKFQLIVVLFILAVLAAFRHGWPLFWWIAFGASYSAILDSAIWKIGNNKTIIPLSAIITGLIVSGILNHQSGILWLVVFISLAIISKHIIRINNAHVFNPAIFGLLSATLLGFPLIWPIEANIYLIILAGIYFAYSFKKIPHVLGFLIFFCSAFFIIRTNPLLLVSWFFVFVMLIEPKTSGYGDVRGFIFGALSGIFSIAVYKLLPQYDFFVVSLAFANSSRVLLDKYIKA